MDRSYFGGKDYNKIVEAYDGFRGSNPEPTNKVDYDAWIYCKELAEKVSSN